jgi:hypothetical protein
MKKRKWIFVVAPLALALFIAIGGEVVLKLWNWLLPAMFGWRQITFWQALGLLALCRILFGGFGAHGPYRPDFRRKMAEKCERMTPEEREKLHQQLHDRWGAAPPPESNPSA